MSLKWPPIVAQAKRIVESYEETGVTLRQLFYRLVAVEILPNTEGAYKSLSDRTAKARRAGTFPALIDRNRSIHRHAAWESPEDARAALRRQYRRDRTEGQEHAVYIGAEKATMVEQFSLWFGNLGLPILALGGYSSQTYADDVREDGKQGRDSILIYAGDFDPSGMDISRDFCKRADCFDVVRRVALTPEQVARYGLATQPIKRDKNGKPKDSRAAKFITQYGDRVAELEALPPETLRELYQAAVADFWDVSAYQASMAREAAERAQL
jgi:hypothetical protein